MQNIKIAPTFFIIKNVVEIKNVKKRKKRDISKKRKKSVLHLWGYCELGLVLTNITRRLAKQTKAERCFCNQ